MSDEHYEKLKIMYACLNKNCEKEEKASTKYLNNVRANKTELDKNNEALKARTRCATDKCARELKGVLEGMVKTSQDAIDLYLELKSKAKTPEEKDMIKNGINYNKKKIKELTKILSKPQMSLEDVRKHILT